MKPKQLIFHDAAREKIRCGVDALAEAVKVTLGPRGRTVILERDFGPPQIVNSGVLVAKSIELEDRFENMGAQLLREVAARTSEMAGDGTTTATVLAHGMIQEGLRYLAGGMNPMDLKRGIELAIETVVAELKRISKPCATSQEIAHVAAISAHNDRSIGDLLASAIDKVGREGAISIEDGSGLVSVLEVIEGMQFDRGFLSPYFINNAERQSAILEDVSILLCEGRLTSLKDLLPLLEEIVKEGRPLQVGLTLGKVKLSDLGRATRAEMTKESTTLIGGAGLPKVISERIASIRRERELATSDYDREKLDERATKLSDGVALLRTRRVLAEPTGSTLDETSGIRLVSRALEEPLRRIVSNAGDEPSVILNRVDEAGPGLWLQRGHSHLRRPAANGGDRPSQGHTAGVAKRGVHRQPDSHHGLHDCHGTQASC